MGIIICVIIGAIVVMLYVGMSKNGKSKSDSIIYSDHPYNNDYMRIKINVPEGYDYMLLDIKGTSFRTGLSSCVGDFDGQLVPEPTNPYDPNAIAIKWHGKTLLGYVDRELTADVREFTMLPCNCHGMLVRDSDDKGHIYYWGQVVVMKKKM